MIYTNTIHYNLTLISRQHAKKSELLVQNLMITKILMVKTFNKFKCTPLKTNVPIS